MKPDLPAILRRVLHVLGLIGKAVLLLVCALITLGSGWCALAPLQSSRTGAWGLVCMIGVASVIGFGYACFALVRSIRRSVAKAREASRLTDQSR